MYFSKPRIVFYAEKYLVTALILQNFFVISCHMLLRLDCGPKLTHFYKLCIL